MSLLLSGDAFLDDIDDWVDRWHDGEPGEEIWDYLGLTESEWMLWVERPESLRFIVAAREREQPLERLLSEHADQELVAARANDAAEARAVTEWLRSTGRLS